MKRSKRQAIQAYMDWITSQPEFQREMYRMETELIMYGTTFKPDYNKLFDEIMQNTAKLPYVARTEDLAAKVHHPSPPAI